MPVIRFVDLFAGLGGFHRALTPLGHQCVFASEINPELVALYRKNFPESRKVVFGDIRLTKEQVPPHDLLCAGFPCQPFSKSGYQNGSKDRTRGTLFHEIIAILRSRRPPYVLLENVGNFERHNYGRTWGIVRESLEDLGYHVCGTTHVTSGGHGLISPHHLGFPHTRERFFILASQDPITTDPFPQRDRSRATTLSEIAQDRRELSELDIEESSLSAQQIACIDHWNRFLSRIPPDWPLPSFPIWGDEIGASYPYLSRTPSTLGRAALTRHLSALSGTASLGKEDLLELLPSYARSDSEVFPSWKIKFIRQNRDWLSAIGRYIPGSWISRLREFPASWRKLEWNCQGESRDLWEHVLQFRPSGLRAKRFSSSPALVSMSTTQIPILGPYRRFVTRTEGLRLQGFPDCHNLPAIRSRAFAALGNAVHVGVVAAIVDSLIHKRKSAR